MATGIANTHFVRTAAIGVQSSELPLPARLRPMGVALSQHGLSQPLLDIRNNDALACS